MTGVAVIVQARLSSTRLPGKVLMELAGRTVLEHVLERCSAISSADVVCCATVTGEEGEPIRRVASGLGVEVYQGSRDDVLDRYYGAARWLGAGLVMRVCSDCPLIDPYVCDRVLRLHVESGADFACNNMPPSWPHGLDCESFSYSWLEKAAMEATAPAEREHVSAFIRNHQDARKVNVPGPGGMAASERWTLDYPEDLEYLRAMFERLPSGPAGWDYRVPLAIAASEPELAAINAARRVRAAG